MELSGWYVAAGALGLLLVLFAGAWLVTVIVRRSNDRAVGDTEELEVTPSGGPPEDPPPAG